MVTASVVVVYKLSLFLDSVCVHDVHLHMYSQACLCVEALNIIASTHFKYSVLKSLLIPLLISNYLRVTSQSKEFKYITRHITTTVSKFKIFVSVLKMHFLISQFISLFLKHICLKNKC